MIENPNRQTRDRWETYLVDCVGGLILDEDPIQQASERPGSAIDFVNYEPHKNGGYRRVSGYSKFDINTVTGTGDILGLAVYASNVIACRGANVVRSTGSGWTSITSARTSAGVYDFDQFNWGGTNKLIMADKVNRPATWDGTTYTLLSNVPLGIEYVAEFKKHMFYADEHLITFSAPLSENNVTVADGAGSINIGDKIVRLKVFRDNLFVFCRNSIHIINGVDSATFAATPLTKDMGCLASFSVQEVGGDLIFLAPDGLRPISATERLGDYEIAVVSRPISTHVTNFYTDYKAASISSVVVHGKTQYRLLGGSSSVTAANTYGIIGGQRRRGDSATFWEWSRLKGFSASCAASGYISNVEKVIHGGLDGYVYTQDSGNSMSGSNIYSIYKSPFLHFGDPHVRKVLQKLKVYLEVEGTVNVNFQTVLDYEDPLVVQPQSIVITDGLTAAYVYDDAGTTYDGAAVYDASPFPKVEDNLIGSCLTASFVFVTNDTNASHVIRSFTVEFGTGGRR